MGAKDQLVIDEPLALQDLMDLLNIPPAAIVIVDTDLKIRLVNSEAEAKLCITPSHIGQAISDIFAPFRSEGIGTCIRETIKSDREREFETTDAGGRFQIARVKPFRGVKNWPKCVAIVFQDIHDLRNAQMFASSMMGTVPTPLVVLHENLRVRMVNDAFHEHFGTQASDLEEELFLELQENRFDLKGVREALTRVLEEQTPLESFEIEEQGSNGKNHVSITVRLVKPASEKMLLIALNDITARKEAERVLKKEQERLHQQVAATDAELEKTKKEANLLLEESRTEILRSREELRHLTASLLNAQDEERRRVSRELHDDLSQRVAKLQFGIEILEQKVPFSNLEDARQELRMVRDQAGSLAEDLRRVAHQLHPSVLDHLGLAVALRGFIKEFESTTKISVELSADGIPKKLPAEVASCAYRVAQEALRNVVKHSRATRAEVILWIEENCLMLLIRDEGVGFDIASARCKEGIGLIGIEERVRLVSGTVMIETAEECGTSVRVCLPLSAPV